MNYKVSDRSVFCTNMFYVWGGIVALFPWTVFLTIVVEIIKLKLQSTPTDDLTNVRYFFINYVGLCAQAPELIAQVVSLLLVFKRDSIYDRMIVGSFGLASIFAGTVVFFIFDTHHFGSWNFVIIIAIVVLTNTCSGLLQGSLYALSTSRLRTTHSTMAVALGTNTSGLLVVFVIVACGFENEKWKVVAYFSVAEGLVLMYAFWCLYICKTSPSVPVPGIMMKEVVVEETKVPERLYVPVDVPLVYFRKNLLAIIKIEPFNYFNVFLNFAITLSLYPATYFIMISPYDWMSTESYILWGMLANFCVASLIGNLLGGYVFQNYVVVGIFILRFLFSYALLVNGGVVWNFFFALTGGFLCTQAFTAIGKSGHRCDIVMEKTMFASICLILGVITGLIVSMFIMSQIYVEAPFNFANGTNDSFTEYFVSPVYNPSDNRTIFNY